MKSNYKRLGDYIRPVDVRNTDLAITNLQGVSIAKEFVPSIANIIGTDLSTYKIVRTGQFAYGPVTSRNGDKISIALLKGDDCIISSSYSPFEIYKTNELLPEYLMLWFMRPEFDRYARFMSNGSAREVFDWECMCDVDIPVPSIGEQRKVVHDYQAIVDRMSLLRRINSILLSLSQAILKDFMENNSYNLCPLSNIADVIDCLHSEKPKQVDNSIYQLIQLNNIRDDGFLDLDTTQYMISKNDYENWTRKCEIQEGDCVITNVGRMGAVSQAPIGTHAAMGRNMTCIRLKPSCNYQAYLITLLLSSHMKNQMQDKKDVGTIMEALNVRNIPKLLCPIFDDETMTKLENSLKPIVMDIQFRNKELQSLVRLKNITLNSFL